MLALLLTELENPEFRDSALESSDSWCLSSKLVTVRMVEFIREGICCCWICEGIEGRVLPFAPLEGDDRDMLALMDPSEARERVGRAGARSCEGFGALVGAVRSSSPAVCAVSVRWVTETGES